MNSPKVGIIVLNYKNWNDTIECLESLQQIDYPDYQIIVVDNGSGDESIEKIKEWAEGKLKVDSKYVKYRADLKPVFYVEYDRKTAESGGTKEYEEKLSKYPSNRKLVIIQTGENLGFSGGNNVGIKYALLRGYEVIGLLNNDIVAVDKNLIKIVIDTFQKYQHASVVGPLIEDLEGNKSGPLIEESYIGELFLYTFCSIIRKLCKMPPLYIDRRALNSREPVEVYKISGCCMFFLSKFFEKTGLLDENVWLCCEEAIISEKAKMIGAKIYFVPNTKVIHKEGSVLKKFYTNYERFANFVRNREYFLKKYKQYSGWQLFLLRIVREFRLALLYLLSKLRKK